jgi:F0F1-type ATP synthase beta subunit
MLNIPQTVLDILDLDLDDNKNELIECFDLDGYINQPYYVVYEWERGREGEFADNERVIEIMNDWLERSVDDVHCVQIYSVATGEQLKVKSITFDEEP